MFNLVGQPKVRTKVSSATSSRKMKESIIHPGSRKASQMMKEVNRVEKKEKYDFPEGIC